MRILVVEDEPNISSFIRKGLVAEGFAVDVEADGNKAFKLAKEPYELIVLDIKLPHKGGREICRQLRVFGIRTPILIVSSLTDADTKAELLDTGADDYLTKPFAFNELLARIRALLRREPQIIGSVLAIEDLKFDTATHTVTRAGKPLELTKKEYELLEYMMRHPGIILTRNMILQHVWDMNADLFTNTVDVHVRHLRRKVDRGHKRELVHTVRGFGYKLQ